MKENIDKEAAAFKKDFNQMLSRVSSLKELDLKELKDKKIIIVPMGKKRKAYRRSNINNSFVELV